MKTIEFNEYFTSLNTINKTIKNRIKLKIPIIIKYTLKFCIITLINIDK
jgi:hypothetical protein